MARMRVVREVLPLLAGLPSPVARDGYIRRFAPRLGVTVEALRAEVEGFRHKGRRSRAIVPDEVASAAERPASALPDPFQRAERELLHLLVSQPEGLGSVRRLGLAPEELERPEHAAALAALLGAEPPPAGREGRDRWLLRVIDTVCDEGARALLLELGFAPPLPADPGGRVLEALVERIRQRPLAREAEALRRRVEAHEAGGQAVPPEWVRTLQELNRKLQRTHP
jgi:hypothetical protein